MWTCLRLQHRVISQLYMGLRKIQGVKREVCCGRRTRVCYSSCCAQSIIVPRCFIGPSAVFVQPFLKQKTVETHTFFHRVIGEDLAGHSRAEETHTATPPSQLSRCCGGRYVRQTPPLHFCAVSSRIKCRLGWNGLDPCHAFLRRCAWLCSPLACLCRG